MHPAGWKPSWVWQVFNARTCTEALFVRYARVLRHAQPRTIAGSFDILGNDPFAWLSAFALVQWQLTSLLLHRPLNTLFRERHSHSESPSSQFGKTLECDLPAHTLSATILFSTDACLDIWAYDHQLRTSLHPQRKHDHGVMSPVKFIIKSRCIIDWKLSHYTSSIFAPGV